MSSFTLDNFLGQESITKNLKIFMEAAKKESRSLDHVIIYGPPGLGKTTLANLIAFSMSGNLKNISAPTITKVSEITSILAGLKKNDILFIDEIHRLNKNLEEILYIAMENFRLDVVVGKNNNSKPISIPLPHFTLIGATTMYGKLSTPLRHRFGITFKFDYYSNDAIIELLKIRFNDGKVVIDNNSYKAIAEVSRGIPRLAIKYTKRILDFYSSIDTTVINIHDTQIFLKELGININGLDNLDIKYINTLASKFCGGPVGVDTLASALDESPETLENSIEPYLMRLGLIYKTSKGRILTEEAIQYIKNGFLSIISKGLRL
jgi:Holliday junction DNA helicase RuvB